MALDEELVVNHLVNMGMITDAQAEEARDKVLEDESDIITALEELGHATEDDVLGILAVEYGMETFDLSGYRIPEDVLKALTPEIAKRYSVVPVMQHDNTITIALSDPTCLETIDTLRYILKQDIETVVCKRKDITYALDQNYGSTEEAVESILADATSSEIELTALSDDFDDGTAEEGDDAPIIRLVSLVIIEAYRSRASDIHLEPMEKRFRIRYRIDGILVEMENPPKYLQNNILSRLKIMAKLDITEHRVPQDGRIMFSMPGKTIDLRVSSVPTQHGESIVMRILDKSSIQLGIPELGFLSDDQKLVESIIAFPDGIFLVTGPTGSGKTTSLYAFLNELNTPNRKIITAEDPVEYELSGINQVQCDTSIGMTFARALRAMLRQAPNIVMVGEIRDLETGGIAINAALTGHLVFSTLHTNDAPTAVARLVDIGVKPFLVASSVRAIMAQRLVRRVCKACAEETPADEGELITLDLKADYFEEANLLKGRGCSECKFGYRGRVGIYEIFMVEDSIVQLIFRSATTNEIRQRARELGMRTLRDDGLRKAMTGLTTLEEVIRITKANEEEELQIDA